MASFDRASVDLVVTSPPYNADKAYASYSDKRSLQEYKEFASAWMNEVPRLMKPNGSFWLNVGYTKLGANETLPLTYLYYEIAQKVGLKLVQELVWHYEGGMSYKRRFSHRTERWMWFALDPDNLTFNLDDVRDASLNRTIDKRNNPLGKNPTDYWYFDRVVGGNGAGKDKSHHPCQFPVPMIERIVKACSNPGEVILDPFGGSGSTAVAAYNQGRRGVCIEMDESYHRVASDKLQKMQDELIRFDSK
jgi:DNA modification methylase